MRYSPIFLLTAAVLCFAAAPSRKPEDLPDTVDRVRAAVVKVEVVVRPVISREGQFPKFVHIEDLPQNIRGCFSNGSFVCIAGTGFFVNDNAELVTALHVVDNPVDNEPGTKQILDQLRAAGLEAGLKIGVSLPNVENGAVVLSSLTTQFDASVVAEDPKHDLALLRLAQNPFKIPRKAVGGDVNLMLKVLVVKLAANRSRDGESVISCGFPYGQAGMETSSGVISSAWESNPLNRASLAGYPEAQEVYHVDLGLNPGNSGGPVFRVFDRAVIGVADARISAGKDRPLGVVIPSTTVIGFLKAQGSKWTPSDQKVSLIQKIELGTNLGTKPVPDCS